MAVKLLDQWLLKEQAQVEQKYKDLNAITVRKPDVIFLGDSIVEYFPLQELLQSSKTMLNRGVRGYKSYQLRQHLADLLAGQAVDKIFILIGTNDIGEELAPAASLENLETIIQSLSRDYPLAQVHLLSVLPVNEGAAYKDIVYVRTNKKIQQLNQAYQDLADIYVNVSFVDVYDSLLDQKGQLAEEFTSDGVHLTVAGYAVLAKELENYL